MASITSATLQLQADTNAMFQHIQTLKASFEHNMEDQQSMEVRALLMRLQTLQKQVPELVETVTAVESEKEQVRNSLEQIRAANQTALNDLCERTKVV